MRPANTIGGYSRGRFLNLVPLIISGMIMIVLPAFVSPFILSIMDQALALAIFAMSLDLFMGYVGLSSLGHAVFFGAGAYTVAMFMLHKNINSFWITAPAGVIVAIGLAALLGLIIIRFTGLYFILLTVALGEVFYSVVWKFKWFQSPGIEACIGLSRPDLGIPNFDWTPARFYYFTFLFFAICFFLIQRLVKSPFGHALKGIRENEGRMRALGYNTWLYKYIAYILAGLFAGVGGVLFVYEMRFTTPELVGIQYSVMAIMAVIFGGAGTIFGPAIGGMLMVIVEFLMSLIAPARWPLIMGTIFVITIMFFRGGLAPHLHNFWRKIVIRIWKH